MAIVLPEHCPRGFGPEVCRPLSQVLVDEVVPGVEIGFICCGHLAEAARALLQDRFRVCFRGATSDTMFDHDERDMVDTIAVMMGGLSADHNRRASGEAEAAWNETPATGLAEKERKTALKVESVSKVVSGEQLGESIGRFLSLRIKPRVYLGKYSNLIFGPLNTKTKINWNKMLATGPAGTERGMARESEQGRQHGDRHDRGGDRGTSP